MVEVRQEFTGEPGRAFGVAIIDLLTDFDLPVTPVHYEVIFAYQTGEPQELVADIVARLARGQKITHKVSEALFARYFASARLSVHMMETGESVARELERVVDALRNAGAQTRGYDEALQAVIETDMSSLDAGSFRRVVKQLMSATAEMAVHNQQLSAQMEQSTQQVQSLQSALQCVRLEAFTDRLTGLANRRLFDETLHAKLRQAEETQTPLCLLICDIDHFKRFNDTWGHVVGDQVIRYTASILRQNAPGDALAARYGGEEFAVIFPRTSRDRARAVAEQIHAQVRAKCLSRRSTGEVMGAVTVSGGLAEWRVGDTASGLIERADQCLYFSKRNGRNRITTDAQQLAVA